MRALPIILAILLGTAGCQAGPLPTDAAKQTVSRQAAVKFRIRPMPMRTAARARTFADIHHYSVTLRDPLGTPVTAAGLTNPIRVDAPATTGTLGPIPNGTGYRLSIEAFDAAGASITQGGPVLSTNTFDVTGSTVTYSAGTEAVCSLSLLPATPGTDTTAVPMPMRGLANADLHAIALLNNASHRAMVLPPDQADLYEWAGVQQGLAHATHPSHEIWAWTASTLDGTATSAQRFAYPASADGAIGAVLGVTTADSTLETVPTSGPVSPTLGLRADGAGQVYFSDGATLTGCDLATGATRSIPLWGKITAFTVDQAGEIYTTSGPDIRTPAGTVLVRSGQIGPMAVDDEQTLYWFDASSSTIQRSRRFFGSYLQPETVCPAPAGTRLLAVDAYGNPYFSTGTDVIAARFDETGMALNRSPATYLSAAGLTSLTVDKVGNLYWTDSANVVRLYPIGGAPGVTYRVAGNGVVPDGGADNLTGVAPTETVNVAAPRDLTVSALGVVCFTSSGPGGLRRWIRRLP